MIPFLLLFVGLLLIFLEFYMPGGIMMILGSIAILGSIFLFIQQSNSLIEAILFILGIGVSLFLVIKYTLRLIVHSKPGYSIYLKDDQEGFRASKYDEKAIGKIGVVVTDLKPAGYILVDGKRQQAISISGYIPIGAEVIVLRGNEESLIVKSK